MYLQVAGGGRWCRGRAGMLGPTLLRSCSPCQQFPHAARSVASAPRIQFQFFNLYSGQAEETFADFEAAEIGTELAGGRGEGLTEMIERHGSVAGDLMRGIGREQRLRHDLEAAFEEVVEAHVGAEERKEIVVERARRLAADDQGEAVLDGFTQERTEGGQRRGLVRDVDDEETSGGTARRILDELDVKRAHEEIGHGIASGALAGERGDGG